MRLNLVAGPAQEPISISDVEGQVRLSDGDVFALGENLAVQRFIESIRQRAEATTRRAFITQTWDMMLDAFPGRRDPIEIPLPPLQSITSITYIDTTGATQTIGSSAFRVLKDAAPNGQPAKILPVYGAEWPAALDDLEVVTIRFVAGYGPILPETPDPDVVYPDNVPSAIKQWMLLNVGNLWENRETETVANGKLTMVDLSTLADSLLADFRIYRW